MFDSKTFKRKRRATRISVLLVACAVMFIAPLTVTLAQQPSSETVQFGVRPARGMYAIRNARIVTVSGADIERGTIVIQDGKIASVGTSVQVPAGAQEIDGNGLTVFPGMIDLGTAMGLVEIPSGAPGTVDTAETGDVNPNAQAFYAINPHSAHIAVTRVNGITSVLSSPAGGLVSGQAAFINLEGTTQPEMALVPQAALVINFPRLGFGGGGFFFAQAQQPNITEATRARDAQVEQLRKTMRDAEAYGRAQDAYTRDSRNVPRPDKDVVLASLVPYVRGERMVIFRAERETEIRAAIRFAEEMKLKPIISGGNDAWKVAQLLRDKSVPVILTGVLDLPASEDDQYDTLYANAAKLQQAGVRFCISSGDTGADVRNLPYHAGMAAAFGLAPADALKAVTLYPAQIMGLADRLGSIEAGKIANLVIADGDILDPRTNVRYLFIDGRNVPLTSRHTQLNEAFRNRR